MKIKEKKEVKVLENVNEVAYNYDSFANLLGHPKLYAVMS